MVAEPAAQPDPDRAGTSRRILMSADTVGGVWQYAIELCRQLCAQGDEVVLATMGGEPGGSQQAEAGAIAGLELRPSKYRLEWMDDPWADVGRAGDWLLSLEREVRPDIVHLNHYAHGDLPWRAPVLMVGHSCVLSWWQAVHREPAPAEWERYRDRVRSGLQAAERVVAPTRAMLVELERHYGPLRACGVIANGRSPAGMAAAQREPLVLAAGRLWDEGKNIAALTAVAPRLPWPVFIAGADQHPDGGRIELPNVRLLGQLPSEELASWLARAAIYALPARYEPFGLSALEAALAGCALVLGDIPSLREVWGDCAVFVPPDDHGALEATLRRLMDDDSLRSDYAARAAERAGRYTPASMASGYRAAYADLLAGRDAARGNIATMEAYR